MVEVDGVAGVGDTLSDLHARNLVIVDICDWILENRLKCHTGPIPFYWPS